LLKANFPSVDEDLLERSQRKIRSAIRADSTMIFNEAAKYRGRAGGALLNSTAFGIPPIVEEELPPVKLGLTLHMPAASDTLLVRIKKTPSGEFSLFDMMCPCCCVRPINTVMTQCGHATMCKQCAAAWLKPCSMCRADARYRELRYSEEDMAGECVAHPSVAPVADSDDDVVIVLPLAIAPPAPAAAAPKRKTPDAPPAAAPKRKTPVAPPDVQPAPAAAVQPDALPASAAAAPKRKTPSTAAPPALAAAAPKRKTPPTAAPPAPAPKRKTPPTAPLAASTQVVESSAVARQPLPLNHLLPPSKTASE
jgi:hypothetical protein